MRSNTTNKPPPAAAELPAETMAWCERQAKIFAAKMPACFDVADLTQVATIAAWKALGKFDGRNGTPLHGFLYSYVVNAMRMSVRRRNWTEATAPRVQLTDPSPIDQERDQIRSQQRGLVLWLIRERLTPMQQFCFHRHLAGEGTAEIAAAGKITRRQVCILIEDAQAQIQHDVDEIRRLQA
jgi:RNA polymerase sigma factor (sigma-70 family)